MKNTQPISSVIAITLFLLSFLSVADPNYYAEGLQAEYAGNYEEAINSYKKSQLSDAKFALGRLYRDVFNNTQESFFWFLKASEQGDIFAQYEIGLLYRDGNEVVAQDKEKAKKWLMASANKGHGEAAFALFKIDESSKNALLWLKKSANNGVTDAMYEISNAYRYGDYGQPINTKLSEMWFIEASKEQE